MKHQDLKGLTHGELSNLRYEQLMLGKLELLEQITQDVKIPSEIVNKIYKLCSDVLKVIGESSVSLPANEQDLTLKNAADFMKFVITLHKFTNCVVEIIRDIFDYLDLH